MSPPPAPRSSRTEKHVHCEMGLFHSVDPIHTHAHCKNCFRMRRCEGSSADWKLLRCSRCNIATYCSKACQKAHWRQSHKFICNFHGETSERAAGLSGNPKAWSDLATWIEFHHASLVNAALAQYLHEDGTLFDVAANALFFINLDYRNDPSLPPEQKFGLRTARLFHKDLLDIMAIADPDSHRLFSIAFSQYAPAMKLGKQELGRDYAATGAYFLSVRFRPGVDAIGVDGIPFWKHFGIDKQRARAVPACRPTVDQLKENLEGGKRLKFCCGRVPGMPTCCCGGWTHKVSGHAPKEACR